MSDEVLRLVAQNGGVVMVTFVSSYVIENSDQVTKCFIFLLILISISRETQQSQTW